MKFQRPIGLGLGLLLAACASSPEEPEERPRRPEAPYSELGASEIYVQKGIQYMEAGNLDIALKDLKKAIELDKDNSNAYNAMAVLQQRLDNPVEAEALFQKAIAKKADNFSALNNYGRFLCARGRHDEAMPHFQTVIASKLYDQPWIPLTNAGLCAKSAGKIAEAEQYLRRSLELRPDFPPTLLELAKLSRETGQLMSARAFLQRYHGVVRPTPESLLLGIEIETALGNRDSVEEYARLLRKLYPGSKETVEARRRFGAE
jgi:type IV pilus assembly protein PilF